LNRTAIDAQQNWIPDQARNDGLGSFILDRSDRINDQRQSRHDKWERRHRAREMMISGSAALPPDSLLASIGRRSRHQ